MKKIFLVFITFFLLLIGNAQDKWRFHSQNFVGLLEGKSGTAYQLQTINGFQKKSWFAGAGLGLDDYFFRSVPLFVHVSKYMPFQNGLFVSAGGGLNFPWVEKELIPRDAVSVKYPVSNFWETSLGYKIKLSSLGNGILFSAGYSFKHVKETFEKANPCLIPPCPYQNERYDYRLKRLSFKLGYVF